MIHINRNTARNIIFGHQELGDLQLADLYPAQGIDKLQLCLGHIHLQDKSGNLLQIDQTYIQLITRTRQNFINSEYKNYQWVEQGWMMMLWQFVKLMDITFVDTSIWGPKPARRNDTFIMEEFLALKIIDKILHSLNKCRIYLQVLTMSDISTADGKMILPEVKKGEKPFYRCSILTWPIQEMPSKEDWEHW